MLKKLFTSKRKRRVNLEIDRVQTKLSTLEEDSDEYRKTLGQLTTLFKLRGDLKFKPSTTTIAVVGGIIQILLILNYEKTDIITSRASSFVTKGRG